MTININKHLINFVTLSRGVQKIQCTGAEIAFDYQCAVENPTQLFLLVNGFQRTRLDFRAFRNRLEKLVPHVATVALDNRYCGETKVLDDSPLTIQMMAQDVLILAKLFLEKLNLSSFSVLGISMGGMIAQTLVTSFERQEKLQYALDNLFLVSTTSGGEGRIWPRPVNLSKEPVYENKYVDLESCKAYMSRFFADRFLRTAPLLFETMCKNMVKAGNGENNFSNASVQYQVSWKFDGVQQLKNMSAKNVVIFTGDEDKIIPMENSIYLNENINKSQLKIYPQTGHLILIEEPEVFAKDVASYFI